MRTQVRPEKKREKMFVSLQAKPKFYSNNARFTSISYVSLYLEEKKILQNQKISWEGACHLTHIFPGLILVSRLNNRMVHTVDDLGTDLGLTKLPSSIPMFLGINILGFTEWDLKIFNTRAFTRHWVPDSWILRPESSVWKYLVDKWTLLVLWKSSMLLFNDSLHGLRWHIGVVLRSDSK